jgi:hypothetical protein
MIDNAENVERELSDAELEAANISGALLGHHWHPGLFGGFFGGGLVNVGLGGFGGGFQPTFVEQQPQVLLVQEPVQAVSGVQSVSTVQQSCGQQSFALVPATGC